MTDQHPKVQQAARDGETIPLLVAMRDNLARSLDRCANESARAAMARQLLDLQDELDELGWQPDPDAEARGGRTMLARSRMGTTQLLQGLREHLAVALDGCTNDGARTALVRLLLDVQNRLTGDEARAGKGATAGVAEAAAEPDVAWPE